MIYQYAYLIGCLGILFPVWLAFFLYRKDLRKDMWTMSLLFGICGPLSEIWYLQDYWKPQTFTGTRIGIEDFLFGFFIGGIASVIYLEVFNKHLARYTSTHRRTRFSLSFLAIFIFLISFYILGLNSIYASMVSCVLVALFMYYYRRDLCLDGIVSGVFVGATMFLAYLAFLSLFPEAIHKWWFLNNISGILIVGIPLEEIAWAFSLGLVAGPAYEFLKDFKIAKK